MKNFEVEYKTEEFCVILLKGKFLADERLL